MRRTRLLCICITLLCARTISAQTTHGRAERTAALTAALAAVRAAPASALDRQSDYARTLGRGACASPVTRLRAECLMTASRRYCRDAQCAITMDVIVSNLLGEAQLVPTEQRYQILSREKDYRRALAREVRRQQGALALDFRLRMGAADGDETLAREIDDYCRRTADDTGLAWQTCASSLVWFIARQP